MTLYFARDCYCYRTWNLCPPCADHNRKLREEERKDR